MTPQTAYQNLVQKLLRLRAAETRYGVLYGLALILATGLGAGLALAVLEAMFYLSPVLKVAFEGLLGLILIGLLVRYCLYPLFAPSAIDALALRVENHFGGLHQQFISALQLWRDRDRPGHSTALIDAAVLRAGREADAVDFNALIDRARPARMSGVAVALGFVGATLFTVWPTALNGAVGRLARPQTAFERPPETRIALRPGDAEIIAGEPFEIAANLSGLVPDKARLYVRESGVDIWTPIDLPVRRNRVTHRFAGVTRSFTYRLKAHDAETPSYDLTVRPRPMVARITHSDHFPSYTGLPDRRDQEGGDIVVPVGTTVAMRIEASQALDAAWLALGDSTHLTARVDSVQAEVDLTVKTDARYTVGLRDKHMIGNRDPVEYRIVALPDRAPDVRLLRPGADTELGKDMKADLAIEAFDDYGVARLQVRYHLNEDKTERTVPVPFGAPNREVATAYTWDLSQFDLLPGDQITYRVRAYDNNPTPGMGETADYVIRFPSLFEIHQEAEREQRKNMEQMADVRQQSETLHEHLEDMRRDLVKGGKLDWQDQKQLEGALEKQKELVKKLEATAEQIQKTLDRMDQSGLLKPETLHKLQEIQTLLSNIQTPELKQAMEKLQDAMKTVDPERVRQALEAFQQEHDKFQQSLDRAISLLKRVQQEQTLDALNRKLDTLAREQDQIASDLDQKAPFDELARRESQIARDTKAFHQELEKTAEQMPRSTADDLNTLAEAMDKRDLNTRMDQVQRDLSAGKRDPSRDNSRELAQDLKTMSQQLQQTQKQFLADQKKQTTRELKSVLHDLLSLSRAQEETARRADEAKTRDETTPLALEQARTLSGANRMAKRILDASQQSFFVPPQAAAALGRAMKNMKDAAGQFNEDSGRGAAQHAREAMGELNNAAMMIENALGQVAASSSGTGFEEMMKQMGQLSEQQGKVNGQTEGLFGTPRPGQGGQPGWEQMAARQQAIQQALEALRQRLAGQQRQPLGDMGKISGDMEETVRDMRNRHVTPETINRQRQILSRMLDAQKSIHERGESRQRESKTATDTPYRGPGSLPNDLGEADNPLRRHLRDALKEGYSAEYQALIRRYFETLMQDASNPQTTGK